MSSIQCQESVQEFFPVFILQHSDWLHRFTTHLIQKSLNVFITISVLKKVTVKGFYISTSYNHLAWNLLERANSKRFKKVLKKTTLFVQICQDIIIEGTLFTQTFYKYNTNLVKNKLFFEYLFQSLKKFSECSIYTFITKLKDQLSSFLYHIFIHKHIYNKHIIKTKED